MDGVPTPPRGPRPRSLRERFLAWRDRMIARPAFQDWAAAFPLTRGLAKRRALALFDLTAGFVYSQVLRAVVELDLLDRLAEGPRSVAELAAETGLPPDRAERLLAAAASLELLARVDGGYRLGQVGAALRGLPGVAEMVRHHDLLYRDLADPVALFRGEATPELARFWGYVGGHRTHALSAEETAPYTRLMAATQTMISAEVLASYPVRRHRHLLDIGGGDGSFLQAAAARASRLQVTLFDLPAVAAQAEVRFAGSGLSPRARAVGGDFFADALPVGADAVSLLRVLYDHDDGPALEILRRAFAALPPGGSLIVGEPMAETPGAPRVGDAYFSLYILAMTHGRPRSAQALTELIAAAGFVEIRRRRTRRPFLTGLITARRPS